jgi:hypothetical protein
LGYVLTTDGIKPQQKKVLAIFALTSPTGVKVLHRFLGIVQYYRDLWSKRIDMLAPLTSLVGECGHTKVIIASRTKKVPCYWDEVHQKAFNDIKAIIARDGDLAYLDYYKEFEIYTDISSRQMGTVITQQNRPIALFIRKLSTMQPKYSVTEIERLAIVEALKEFKGMLWGQMIKVYTGDRNLIQDAFGLTYHNVYRWFLLLEEYVSEIIHIKGIHNRVVDAISRLDYSPVQTTETLE